MIKKIGLQLRIKISARFSVNFQFRAEVEKVTSRAELKIIQLELLLEPARLGLITRIWPFFRNLEETKSILEEKC